MGETAMMDERLSAAALFELGGWFGADLFRADEPVWAALERLDEWLVERTAGCGSPHAPDGAWLRGDVVVGSGVVIEPGAYIQGPAILADGAVVRQGAYLRGTVVVSEGCVVGHCSELKHSVLLPGAHAPHFNYVGDSLLGRDVNLGCGTVLSNLKLRGDTVKLRLDGVVHDTGRRKFGAVLGDGAQTGCQVVLNPGTVAGRGCQFFPQTNVAGYFPAGAVVRQAVTTWAQQEAGR